MIIFRYLAKEVYVTLVALTAILLLIFLSNQFVHYLNRAVSGSFPFIFLFKLMLLEVPSLAGLLLPLGFYMAVMVSYGRLYAESEMTVLRACGYGEGRLLSHTLLMSFLVFFIVLVMTWWVNPLIATERVKLLKSSGVKLLVQTVVPQRFRSLANGREVFYVEQLDRKKMQANHIFFARLKKNARGIWDVLWADKALVEVDPVSGEEYLIFEKGHIYQGLPGKADFTVATFNKYRAKLPHPKAAKDDDIRSVPTERLFQNGPMTRKNAAEFQWRISVPLMVLVLTMVAVPLSRVNARTGKFAKLFPAILIYIVYANFMFFTRDWILEGKTPIWLGMWWIHVTVGLLGLFLLWRNKVRLSCA